MSHAEHVRHALAAHRARGTPWPAAWASAMQSLPRPDSGPAAVERRAWKHALAWARPAFEAAYRRRALEDTLPGRPLTPDALTAPVEP